jgi:carboxyl-terminal processing protease
VLLLLCAIWFAIGWLVCTWRQGTEVQLVEQVRQVLLNEHLGQVPTSRALSYAAIRGMLREIDDPHTALLEPEVSQRFQADFAGESGVIGLFPERQGDHMVATVVFPGEPAYEAGVRQGDIILSIDGVTIDKDTADAEVILLVRGPVDAPAHIQVQRGDEILDFSPIRHERQILSSRMLPEGIAYVAQYTFTTNAGPKMKAALEELLAQQPRALIWDLRSNGGGSMDTAHEVLSYFVRDGLLFMAERNDGEFKRFVATGDVIAGDIPLVVLVSGRTYSAAETAAATIGERARGTVIGDTTYGKGTIQAFYPLVGNATLQTTVAKWLGPSGTWYGERGVTPEIAVSDNEGTAEDEALQYAVEYLLTNSAP